MSIYTEAVATMEQLRAELARRIAVFDIFVNSTCGALERAGVESMDSPGEAIDVLVADLRKEITDARRTSEYWKAEHLAGNAIIRALEDALRPFASVPLSDWNGAPDESAAAGSSFFITVGDLRRAAALLEES